MQLFDRVMTSLSNETLGILSLAAVGASLKEAGDDIKLYPGMPAEVYILTHSRTAIQYLLDPITNTLNRSFRES